MAFFPWLPCLSVSSLLPLRARLRKCPPPWVIIRPPRSSFTAAFKTLNRGGKLMLTGREGLTTRLGLAALLCFVFTASAAAQTTWTLAWSDEFNGPAGSAVDGAKWVLETGNGSNGWGNHERQYYTNTTRNAAMDGAGNLVITAYRESLGKRF